MRTQVFTLPECASLSSGQLFLPPSTPLHIFSSYCKIMKEVLHNCPFYWSFITPLGRSQADRLPHTFTWPSAWAPMPTESVTPDHSYSALTHKPTQIHSLALSCMKRILMRNVAQQGASHEDLVLKQLPYMYK